MELYRHQLDDIDRFKDSDGFGIFGEMGTGKSATALKIAEHKYLKGDIDRLLIIAPNDIHKQWTDEQVPTFLECKHESVCLYGSKGLQKFVNLENTDRLNVVSVNVDTFSTASKWKDIVTWALRGKTMIVLDEATVIKNIRSVRTERLLYSFNDVVRRNKRIMSSKVKTVSRVILTGTPVTNGFSDLWALFEFIKPNFFGMNAYVFREVYGLYRRISVGRDTVPVPINEDVWKAIKGMDSYNEACYTFGITSDTYHEILRQDRYYGPFKRADELRKKVLSVSVIRLLSECVDMPDKVFEKRVITMSGEIAKAYNKLKDSFVTSYNGSVMSVKNKISLLLRLQMILSGFIVNTDITVDDDGNVIDIPYGNVEWIGKSNPKLDMLYHDVSICDKPLIIMTRFSAEAERIYNDLSKEYKVCLMTGWKRVGSIEEFKEGKYDIMVGNLKMISRGFNLQNSHTILYYSNTFSLEDRLQSEGRVFRIGQKNRCLYVDYLYEGSVDSLVLKALEIKQNMLDFIRGKDISELLCG